jgi:serine/threonine protein kinase
MTRTQLRVDTPLGSRLLLSTLGHGRETVSLTFLGGTESTLGEQQATLRHLLATIHSALAGERWAAVSYAVVQHCVGCRCVAGGKPGNCRNREFGALTEVTINALCEGLYFDADRRCPGAVRNARPLVFQAAAQEEKKGDDEPWPWPRHPLLLTSDRLTGVTKLGEGQFGAVFSALLDRAFEVAVKTLKPVQGASVDAQIRDAAREAFVYEALPRHRNVVPLVAQVDRVFDGAQEFVRGLVLPLASRGSLEKLLEAQGPLRGRAAIEAIAQIAAGLAHLHANKLLHRDLAARNVLIFADGRLAITDFGLTREVRANEGEELVDRVLFSESFPIRFVAPEVLNSAPRYDYYAASDVWMLALTAWQLLTGRLPFAEIDNHLAAAQAAASVDPANRARLRWDTLGDDVAPAWLLELLARCCEFDRVRRPTAAEIAKKASEELAKLGPSEPRGDDSPLDGPLLRVAISVEEEKEADLAARGQPELSGHLEYLAREQQKTRAEVEAIREALRNGHARSSSCIAQRLQPERDAHDKDADA